QTTTKTKTRYIRTNKTKRRSNNTPGLTKPQPSSKIRTTKDPVVVVPIKPVHSSAHRVPNARDSRRKVGVPDQARWTGRRRTGNGADPRASASSKLLVAVVAASVSVVVGVKGAVAAGAKRSGLRDAGWRVGRVRRFLVLSGRR